MTTPSIAPRRAGAERTLISLTALFAAAVSMVEPVPAGAQAQAQAGAQSATGVRGYCSDRPGLGTPSCTIDRGRISVETGLVDWQRDRSTGSVSDLALIGETLVRIGVGDAIEIFGGARPLAVARIRENDAGGSTIRGTGDALMGVKVNLANPDGSGFSVAVMPFATLPLGNKALGAGRWTAGISVPLSYAIRDDISLQLTPRIDASADQAGYGRHPACGLVAGVGMALRDAVSITHELAVERDHDPDDPTTRSYLASSLAWMLRHDLQFDFGAVLGLDAASPDARFYVGIARLF